MDVYKQLVVALMTIAVASSTAAQEMSVPFMICAQSDTWARPSADVQSKIWNDNRYKDVGAAGLRVDAQRTGDMVIRGCDGGVNA